MGKFIINEEEKLRILEMHESNRAYGHEEIKGLYNNLKDDEYVHLDDFSDALSGEVVTKIEYVKRMLRSAIDNEDWTKVKNSINFIDSMMKS
jgi:hypothetical protein